MEEKVAGCILLSSETLALSAMLPGEVDAALPVESLGAFPSHSVVPPELRKKFLRKLKRAE